MRTVTVEKTLSYEEERGKPMPSLNHSAIQMNLGAQFMRDHQFRVHSELTLEIGGKPMTPDLSVYRRTPLDLRHDVPRCTEPPLLVVEILSPQQPIQEIMTKIDTYFAFGVKSCWVLSPTMHSIQVLTSDGKEIVLNSGIATDPVTGLTADLSAVFS